MALSREEEFTIEDLMKSAANLPYLDSGLEYLNAPSEVIFNRMLNRVSPTDPDGPISTTASGGARGSGGGGGGWGTSSWTDIYKLGFPEYGSYFQPSDPDGPDPRRGMFRVTPGREGESVYGEENFTFEDLMKSAANLPYLDSGLEDLNDEEKMNKLLAALAADEVPEIRDIFAPPPGYDVDGRLLAGDSRQLDHRIFQPPPALPPNHPSLQRSPSSGMFTPTIPSSPSPNPENWDNWGGLGEFSNKSDSPPGEEPDKKGGGPTLWDVLAMGLGGIPAVALRRLFFNKKNGMFKDMFKNTEFKPWALDKFEDRMNEAPLLERWAIDMKEQIGWQYMTPDERKDYIKNNKHDKNNHIIMHYNMYRRR